MQPNSITDASPDAQSPASFAKGVERFAQFVINRRQDGEFDMLGAGAMGITYRAYDTQLERFVALKVIHPQWVHDPEIRSRFAREAKAAARLQHPNIASVLFQGEEGGTCFYAMELVAGENLHHYVERVGALSPVHALQMVHQIALALVGAAKEGVLHRDLKPANVMLTSYHEGGAPHLKVIDFGLAKLSSDLPASFATGGFLGTPEFASPEQCEEKPLDARSDLYSLGATLWFLLTARAPFSGSMLTVMKAQVSAELPFETLSGAPEPLLAALHRLLAKNRDERPPTALDAAREIENAIRLLAADRKNYAPLSVEKGAASAQPQRPAERGRRGLVTSAVVVTCSAALAGALSLWRAGTDTERRSETANVEERVASGQKAPQELRTLPIAQSPSPADPGLGSSPRGVLTNSLGMVFVRVPNTEALFSVWETRVRDFAAFSRATGHAAASAGSRNEPGWNAPGFPQDENHPVVYVTVNDAQRFCVWLTTTERKAGRISTMQEYRLPSRREWDDALGLPPPDGARGPDGPQPPLPPESDFSEGRDPFPRRGPQGPMADEHLRVPPRPGEPPREGPGGEFSPERGPGSRPKPPFHWSSHAWPPPTGFGNFADESARQAGAAKEVIAGWRDGFAFSAPVGRFSPNPYGIFDLSGNVWEMCHDGPPEVPVYGKLGGSWATATPEELRVHQIAPLQENERSAQVGFRCVLVPIR